MEDASSEEHIQKWDWKKADARVLGQILAAQNIVFTLTDTQHIADFYAQALIKVPGLLGCRICLEDISVQTGEMENGVCAQCKDLRKQAIINDNLVSAESDFKCGLTPKPDLRFISLNFNHHHFGYFVFKIKNAAIYDIYQPFINNLANYVTLSLENRFQKSLLQKAHDELERKVEERTHDLAAANKALTVSRQAAFIMMEEAVEARRRTEQTNIELQNEIVERKRAEEALKEQYSTLHGIIDSINALIFSVDRHYRYTSFNLGHAMMMKTIYGAEIEQGHSLLEYMTVPEDRETARRNLDRALAGEQIIEESYSGEEQRSQRYFQVSHSPIKTVDGEIIGVAVLSQDITQNKQAEEAIYEGQQVFRTLVENSQDIIARYDCNCRRIYVNPVFLKAAQIPQQDLLSTTPLQRSPLPTAGAVTLQNMLRKVFDSGLSDVVDILWPMLDNVDHWFNVSAFPEFDREGRIISVMTISRDITARKQVEEKISKLNQELEQRVVERTSQLEAANKELEAFAYSVSHDLRAPLRHIDGFIDLLQKRTKADLDSQSQHYIEVIIDSSHKMGVLIDDLLSFSRMGRNEMLKAQVNLDDLILDILREFTPEIMGRNIEWQISRMPIVEGDRAMLHGVLVNLISNALKFTRPREIARIEIGCKEGDEHEEIFFVRDNGVGFDMSYVDKLFGVFQRLHREDEFEGTGIGLANVRRVINRHGGRVWAEGEIGYGATFYFTLPKQSRKEQLP
jgi:PAS domain S-box-containing protein